MPTYIPKPAEIDRKWHVIDAKGAVLGKLAVTAANVLSGKNKPTYTTFIDVGDHVIVINAAQIAVSGRKETDKMYHQHTGYLGHVKSAFRRRGPRKASRAPRSKTPSRGCSPSRASGARCTPSSRSTPATSIRTSRRSRSPWPPSRKRKKLEHTATSVLRTGKRKTSIARVYLRDGSGEISVSAKALDDYFGGTRP